MNNYEAMKARELARNVEYAQKSAYTITNGIVRWDSNNRVPPADMVEAIATFENIDIEASTAARDEETAASIAKYIEARKNISDEQKAEEAYERRAAFGPGETVVNVLTGERYTT